MQVLLRFQRMASDEADLRTTREFVDEEIPAHLLIETLLRANAHDMVALRDACARRLERLFRDAAVEDIRRQLQLEDAGVR